MLDVMKQELSTAVLYIREQGLRYLGMGNLSVFDRANNLIVIEPEGSGIPPEADNMLVVDMSGNVVEGSGEPAIDVQTHIELYRTFPAVGAVLHSHSMYATAWAQAGRDIPLYGTGHLDFFKEPIPCTRAITAAEGEENYGLAAAACIAETFQKKSLDPNQAPAVLLFQHGAYTWGGNAMKAAVNGAALEHIARLAYLTEKINPNITEVQRSITPQS